MRETRLSGSVEGVVSDHDSYSDSLEDDSTRENEDGGISCRR